MNAATIEALQSLSAVVAIGLAFGLACWGAIAARDD